MTARPRWAVEGRDWPNREWSRFDDVGGIHWHVQHQPRDGAPLVLLIHGTGAATHSWREVAPLLAERYAVLAVDLPGHGFTEGRPAGGMAMAALARSLATLIDTLKLNPDTIVGHSAGAAIGCRMVLDGLAAPRRLIGLNAALLPFPGLAARLFPTLAKLLFANPFAPHVVARMAAVPGETQRFLERATGSRLDARGGELYARLFATVSHCAGALAMMASWDLDTLAADLPRLAVPLDLVHGAEDRAIPAADASRAAGMVARGEAVTLPGLGHLAHEEAPERLAALIAERVARENKIV